MKKIALFTLLIFCTTVSLPAYAETSEDGDYVEVEEGKAAPYSGLLFSYDGMSNVLSTLHQKNKLLQIQKNEELEKLKINLESEIKNLNSKLVSMQEMHDAQMAAKEQAISSLVKQVEVSKSRTYGGIILGTAIGALIIGVIYGNR